MSEKLNEGLIIKALDWAYGKAITQALPGLDSAFSLAESYQKKGGTVLDQIDSLIRWQNTKAAAFGFATGLGGILTVPVSIPMNLASVLFVQIRMIATIAILCGYDVKDDRVKTLIFACMCGSAGSDLLKNVGIDVGSKLIGSVLQKVTIQVAQQVNKSVGLNLLARFTEKKALNMGKAVPIIGAIIGGTFDAVTTNIIGQIAKKTFYKEDLPQSSPAS